MTFSEYPKALYKGGEYISVAGETEEIERRDAGFMDWQDDFKRMTATDADEPALEPVAVEAPRPMVQPPVMPPPQVVDIKRAPLALKTSKSA